MREGGKKEMEGHDYERCSYANKTAQVATFFTESGIRNGKRTAGSSLVLEAPESVRLCFLSFMRPRAQPELPERGTDCGERLLAGLEGALRDQLLRTAGASAKIAHALKPLSHTH